MRNSMTRCLYYKHVEHRHVVVVTNTESWSVDTAAAMCLCN